MRSVEVPIAATSDELHLMIEGKLAEEGREPRNVQVLVDSAGVMSLCDEFGRFLIVTVEFEELESGGSVETEEQTKTSGEDTDESLHQDLEEAQAEIISLKEEVVTLKEQVSQEKDKSKLNWPPMREELNAEEVIIEQLKAQLSQVAASPRDSLRAAVVPDGSRTSSSRETEIRSSSS